VLSEPRTCKSTCFKSLWSALAVTMLAVPATPQKRRCPLVTVEKCVLVCSWDNAAGSCAAPYKGFAYKAQLSLQVAVQISSSYHNNDVAVTTELCEGTTMMSLLLLCTLLSSITLLSPRVNSIAHSYIAERVNSCNRFSLVPCAACEFVY
jgi:hypothetical protein